MEGPLERSSAMAEADTSGRREVGGEGAVSGRGAGSGAAEGPPCPDSCEACGGSDVREDPWLGSTICQQCGHVAADSMLTLQLPYVERGSQPAGTMVTDAEVTEGHFWSDRCAGTEGGPDATGTVERLSARRLSAKFDALAGLRRMCRALQVPKHVQASAKGVLEEAVAGRWGTGDWIEAVTGACLYISIRRARLPLSMLEVADAAGLKPHHAWIIYHRVLSVLANKTVPPVEPSTFVLRAVACVPALANWQGKGGQRQLVADAGTFLSFADSQGLLTGRHPLGVAAACIALVARAHQVAVNVDDVCSAIHAPPSTTLTRFKELWHCLACFACSLPWGAGVDEKSLSRHLPFLLTILRESQGAKGNSTLAGAQQAPMPIGPAPGPALAPPAYQAGVTAAAQKKRNLAEASQRLKESRKRWKGQAADMLATG